MSGNEVVIMAPGMSLGVGSVAMALVVTLAMKSSARGKESSTCLRRTEATLTRACRENSPPSAATALSTQAAVWVLVEHIKHCEWSFQQIADHLRQQRELNLSPESIGQFFQEHDLKKTPNASTPER